MATFVKTFYPIRILSSANASDMLAWISNHLEDGNKDLLINFQNVLFMDSTGLAALVSAFKMVKNANGRLMLCSLNGQARMLFEMANMEQMFEIYDTAEQVETIALKEASC